MFNVMHDPVFGSKAFAMQEKIKAPGNPGFWPHKAWEEFLGESWALKDLDCKSPFYFILELLQGLSPGYTLSHLAANGGDALFWASMCAGNALWQIICLAWNYGGNDCEIWFHG